MKPLRLVGRLTLPLVFVALLLPFGSRASAQGAPKYFPLSTPTRVLPQAQSWEGRGVPHTMAVLRLDRGGYRYWAWYGLTNGGGVGLARSNDLVHWTKYANNPILTNARWISVLRLGNRLYFAFTRDFDTRAPYVALGESSDGLHISLISVGVPANPGQRNQNPNLFRDHDGEIYLTWFRGDYRSKFELVTKHAKTIAGLPAAPETVLVSTPENLMGPFLARIQGRYYLAAESHRPTPGHPKGEWQSHVYWSEKAAGPYRLVANDPVLSGDHGCPSQYVFGGRLYGFTCHDEHEKGWVLEEFTGRLRGSRK